MGTAVFRLRFFFLQATIISCDDACTAAFHTEPYLELFLPNINHNFNNGLK
jgi:hypothetical protein